MAWEVSAAPSPERACHSAAVTAGGALYTWGQGEAGNPGSQVPGGLGHADLANRLVPTLVTRQLLGDARVGLCHGLLEELARPSPWGRTGGWAPVRARARGCLYSEMPGELVKKVLEHCGWREKELGEGVVVLMGGRRTRGGA